jgi:hypothetical protein
MGMLFRRTCLDLPPGTDCGSYPSFYANSVLVPMFKLLLHPSDPGLNAKNIAAGAISYNLSTSNDSPLHSRKFSLSLKILKQANPCLVKTFIYFTLKK